MATATASRIGASAKPKPVGKYALFTIFTLMVLYVLQHNESFLIHPNDPIWEHYRIVKWYLLPHGLTAACAILLGPFQFSDRLRKNYTKLHRVMGRIYVAGAVIGGPLGAFLQYYNERLGEVGATRSFTVAAGIDAVLLAGTTLIAFAFILKGNVQRHRQWMTRSFCVAIVFLEVRVIGGLTGLEQVPGAIETIVWSCLAFAYFFADILIYWQDMIASRPKPKAVAAG
jgi:uncharacterized membrane protein